MASEHGDQAMQAAVQPLGQPGAAEVQMAAAGNSELEDVKKKIKDLEDELAELKQKGYAVDAPERITVRRELAPLREEKNRLASQASADQSHNNIVLQELAAIRLQQRERDEQLLRLAGRRRRDADAPSTTNTEYYRNQRQRVEEPNVDAWFAAVGVQQPGGQPAAASLGPALVARPAELGSVIDGDEDGPLLPKMMDWLGRLPGAQKCKVKLGAKERDAVSFDNLAVPLIWVDTHKYPFLNGYMPDISCFQQGQGIRAFNLVTFIELERGSLTNDHRGKMSKYTKCALLANPARPCATGMLTNLMEMELHGKREANDEELLIALNAIAGRGAAKDAYWQALHRFALGGPWAHGWAVPALTITHLQAARLDIKAFIGHSTAVHVWEVELLAPRCLGRLAVCKQYLDSRRRSSYLRERDCLLCLARYWPAAVPRVFPLLAACDDGQQLIVSQPRAEMAASLTYALMSQGLAGIAVLHAIGFIYRDLEPKHWGISTAAPQPPGHAAPAQQQQQVEPALTEQQAARLQAMEQQHAQMPALLAETVSAVSGWTQQHTAGVAHTAIFDCSTCTPLGTVTEGYAGTLICASDDVLDALSCNPPRGVPAAKQQDTVAFVKTSYLMVHAHAMDHYLALGRQLKNPELNAAGRVAMVRELWRQLLSDQTPAGLEWRSLVELAHVERGGRASYPEYLAVLEELRNRMGRLLPAHL